MADIGRALLAAGFKPQGVETSISQAASPVIPSFLKAINDTMLQEQERLRKAEEQQLKRREKLADIFKTLREAGLSVKDSHALSLQQIGAPEPTEPVSPVSTRGFTAEQAKKRDVGKQNLLRTINYWRNTGNVWDAEMDTYTPIKDLEEFKMWIVNQSDFAKYFDKKDPEITKAFAGAIKKQGGPDLSKEARKENKTLWQKIKEWLGQGQMVKPLIQPKSNNEPVNQEDRQAAIDYLKQHGYDATEANIQATMDQMRGTK